MTKGLLGNPAARRFGERPWPGLVGVPRRTSIRARTLSSRDVEPQAACPPQSLTAP
jgi:hypothetical protein